MLPQPARNRLADGRQTYTHQVGNHAGRLLASGDDCTDGGMSVEQRTEVNGFNDIQKLVAGIVLEPTHRHRCVPQGDAMLIEKRLDVGQPEALVLIVPEVVTITIEDETHYAPHVIDFVGIEEIH